MATALLAAGCVGQPTPAPQSQAPGSPPSARSSLPTFPRPTVPTAGSSSSSDFGCPALVASRHPRVTDSLLPPILNPTIAHPDTGSQAALGSATEQLSALHSFRFSVDIVGRDAWRLEPSALDLALEGTVVHSNGFTMDALVGTLMRETNGSNAAIGASYRVLMGQGYAWSMDNRSGVLEPSSASSIVESMSALAPEGLASRVIMPFATGYKRVGSEMHGGVLTEHYRASPGGVAAYTAALKFAGKITADVWISSDNGYLAAAKITGKGSHADPSSGATIDDAFLVAVEITDPDAATNVVDLPRLPLPDPVRPSGPSVNLQLEYEVMPLDGAIPTAGNVNDIGVSMRVRLDVSYRPIKVDVVKPNRLVVTVCNTTRATTDRRILEANGALTVVPLPASEYGSTATVGVKALPSAGSSIDGALRPIRAGWPRRS